MRRSGFVRERLGEETKEETRSFEEVAVGKFGINVDEKEIYMTDGNAKKVRERGVAQEKADASDDPRKPRRSKVEEMKEAHRKVWVAATPDVDNSESERMGEEFDGTGDETGIDEEIITDHKCRSGKEPKETIVSSFVAKRSRFQILTISDHKVHMKDEINPKVVKEKKVCDQSPIFVLLKRCV